MTLEPGRWIRAPDAGTVARINHHPRSVSTPAPADLIGRAKECRALDELLDAVRGGQSRVLVVRGEAGIGKSALLRHLVDGAHGFRIVRVTGIESEMEMPFAALHQLCVSMLDRLDALPDPQRDAAMVAFGMTAGQPTDGLLLGLAALSLLAETASAAPLLCVIDDAQWLDLESLRTLTFVARRLLADAVGLVFATRGPTRELDDFTELFVVGLHEGDAQTLLSTVLHVALDERVRGRIVAETHGNPLALVEWPRGMTPAELAGGFGMPALTMTGQIEENYRRRIADLPASTQRFLTVAAAEPTGDPAIVWHAASALGVDQADVIPAVEGGLLELGVRVWFRHPLVRSAAYNAASVADRQEVHRALANATDSELDPDRQAWHRALGAPGPDEEIAEALVQSADRARVRGGLAASAALLERSVTLTLDPTRHAQRLLAAASAHLDAGSLEVAAGLLAAAEAIPLDETRRAQVELLRARHAIAGGDIRDAPNLLLRAAERVEPLDLGLARSAHLEAISAASAVGHLSRGVGLREVCEAAIACPFPSAPTTKDWLVLGFALDTIEGLEAAMPALRRALEAADDEAPVAEALSWQGFHISVALALWEFEAFRERAFLWAKSTRDFGALTKLATALNAVAHVFVLEGNLDAAAASLTEAEQIYEATGANLALAMVGAIRAGFQGGDGAAAVINAQIENARDSSMAFSLAGALWARASLCNGRGQYEHAFAAATEAMQSSWDRGGHIYLHEHIESAVRAGHPAAAAATLERLKTTTEPSATDWAMGIQRRSEALLADGADAEVLYREAIERLGRTPVRTELARANLLYGEWLRRENRRVDAREQLRTAHEMFTAIGMQAFAERTRHELAATGETVRKRSADALDELTPQEAHIARLAAEGHTNPEIGAQLFISPRTVEWHLRKVFTKLGISSRRELRDSRRATQHPPA